LATKEMHWNAEDLSCGTICFGQTPENANLLGLQKNTPDK
jgi:hypothetical protein